MLSLSQEHPSFDSINQYAPISVANTPIYQFVLLSLPLYFQSLAKYRVSQLP